MLLWVPPHTIFFNEPFQKIAPERINFSLVLVHFFSQIGFSGTKKCYFTGRVFFAGISPSVISTFKEYQKAQLVMVFFDIETPFNAELLCSIYQTLNIELFGGTIFSKNYWFFLSVGIAVVRKLQKKLLNFTNLKTSTIISAILPPLCMLRSSQSTAFYLETIIQKVIESFVLCGNHHRP